MVKNPNARDDALKDIFEEMADEEEIERERILSTTRGIGKKQKTSGKRNMHSEDDTKNQKKQGS